MIKKYILLIVISLILVMVAVSLAKEGVVMSENDFGIKILKEKVGKLNRGMTFEEVEQQIGKPTFDIGSGRYIPIYLFDGGESLTLDFDFGGKLYSAKNKDEIDLLADSWIAEKANFSFNVDDKEIATRNPIVTIHGKTYIPLKELESQLGIKVQWDAEECAVKILTNGFQQTE